MKIKHASVTGETKHTPAKVTDAKNRNHAEVTGGNKQNEPFHDKTNKVDCAPSEDSDQPGHPPS